MTISPPLSLFLPLPVFFCQDETSVSSEDFDMSDPTWISADHGPASDLSPPNRRERMHSPQNAHIKEEDGKKELLLLLSLSPLISLLSLSLIEMKFLIGMVCGGNGGFPMSLLTQSVSV